MKPRRKAIYLDYAAATPVAAAVRAAMKPFWNVQFANPSSVHSAGRAVRAALDRARARCAERLGCLPDEIIFTSGGTESINLALKGAVGARRRARQHLITSTIEHAATRETLAWLSTQGHRVTEIHCDSDGTVPARSVLAAIRPETTLISLIHVQNEIGTIQPIREVGKALIALNRSRAKRKLNPVLLHVDAGQSPAWLDVNAEKLHAHLISLDSGKIYGPKGIGILLRKKNVELEPQLHGGGHENNLRSGTEAVALASGIAGALDFVKKNRIKNALRVGRLADHLEQRLEREIPGCRITAQAADRAVHIVHMTVTGIDGESLVLELDQSGIATSTGSACSSSGDIDSRILTALGLPPVRRHSSLRFSLGYPTIQKDIDTAVDALKKIVARLGQHGR